jgi:hypothetical protein
MRRLKVDLDDLELAFENSFPEQSYYLGLETGEVLLVSSEMREELEDLYKDLRAGGQELPDDVGDLLEGRDIPEWQHEEFLAAHQIEMASPGRYIGIPRADSDEAYRDMERFIDTVKDRWLSERLQSAIRGRGAFRNFKDVLSEHQREEERWFAFRDERTRQRVLEWLEAEGIEPIVGE